MRARHIGWSAYLHLILLQLAWYSSDSNRSLVFATAPLLLPFSAVLRGSPFGLFWAAVLCLFYFSHGVMMAMTERAERGFALLEVILAVVVILAVGVDGWQRRRAAKIYNSSPSRTEDAP